MIESNLANLYLTIIFLFNSKKISTPFYLIEMKLLKNLIILSKIKEKYFFLNKIIKW